MSNTHRYSSAYLKEARWALSDKTLDSIYLKRLMGIQTKDEEARWGRHVMSEANKRKTRGRKLKKFRARAGYSQIQFAKLLNKSRRAIGYWEAGETEPRWHDKLKLIFLGFSWKECAFTNNRELSILRCAIVFVKGWDAYAIVKAYEEWHFQKTGATLKDGLWAWYINRLETHDEFKSEF